MASWSVFAARAPELAHAGRRLHEGPDGVAVAYLCTSARDGSPRVAPVCPIFALGDLYVCATTQSPKRRDLERDGRFCLHAALGANDEEFQVSGRAQRVLDGAEIASVHGSSEAPDSPLQIYAVENQSFAGLRPCTLTLSFLTDKLYETKFDCGRDPSVKAALYKTFGEPSEQQDAVLASRACARHPFDSPAGVLHLCDDEARHNTDDDRQQQVCDVSPVVRG